VAAFVAGIVNTAVDSLTVTTTSGARPVQFDARSGAFVLVTTHEGRVRFQLTASEHGRPRELLDYEEPEG
jgi:hypothetical protein